MNQLDVDVLAGIKKTKMHSLFESDNNLVNPEILGAISLKARGVCLMLFPNNYRTKKLLQKT